MDPVTDFSNDMNSLVRSIQQYAPDQSISSNLIKDTDNIGKEIKQFENKINIFKNEDITLEENDKLLTDSLFDILNTLIDCKRNLDVLPKIDYSVNDKNDNNEINENDTKLILSYALKLSKFSKIPRTFDGNLLPNNFTWPGDDNLRRGNLAIASMIPDKLVQYENYGPNYVPPEEKMDVDEVDKSFEKKNGARDNNNNNYDDDDDDEDDEDDFIPDRTNSIENFNKGDSATVMAGLDLLDSDDE